jgi:AraC-like DNA-binding protein
LIGIVFYNQANFIWQSRIGMVGLVLLFLWGPLFYFFIKSISRQKKFSNSIFHFFPGFVVVLIAALRFLNFKPLDFYAYEINSELILGNLVIVWVGILSAFAYHLLCIKDLIWLFKERSKYPKKNQFVNIVYLISSSALFYLIVTFILLQTKTKPAINNGIELMLVLFSTIMFVEFYYYWKYPSIFHKKEFGEGRVNYNGNILVGNDENIELAKQNHQKTSLQKLPEELTNELKDKLKKQMLVEKAFKDPKLNIAGLSKIINTKPHILSRVLNEQFNKNFRDYINEYRIKEFIELASSEKYKNYTLLALSYEVGFNSKSTFNLAFKKVTGLSPRNFLKNSEINMDD